MFNACQLSNFSAISWWEQLLFNVMMIMLEEETTVISGDGSGTDDNGV
jgi:hypothetical protein